MLAPVDLPRAAAAAQLIGQLGQLRAAGGADRVAAAEQPAAGVDRQAATERRGAGAQHLDALAGLGDAELLAGDQLAGGRGVVDLGDVDVAGARRPAIRYAARAARTTALSPRLSSRPERRTPASTRTGSASSRSRPSEDATRMPAAPSPIGEHIRSVSGPEMVRLASTSSTRQRIAVLRVGVQRAARRGT